MKVLFFVQQTLQDFHLSIRETEMNPYLHSKITD